jgi:hypothetical protein
VRLEVGLRFCEGFMSLMHRVRCGPVPQFGLDRPS